ncbi:HotDog domain-containing protein [Lentinula aff. lateritia]|uniref:HotDog domain-containing protein n=1 Tax=Lentinula aff. lateritia TaxID=2804960 RepID=A0ACC1TZ39_9AGAR|nr:HotDog domain-containing protein [Lentinula aff. lateritia]
MTTQDPTTISGNASDDIKAFLVDPQLSFNTLVEGNFTTTFAQSVVEKIYISEVSLVQNMIEPLRQESRVVCSMRVAEDMINGMGNLHGGCSALLVDLCSTLAMAALQMHLTGKPTVTVSQAMNLSFHAPAGLGEDLRIINTSMSIGTRVISAKTEIWSATHHRILVSGVHLKMTPTRKTSKL